MKKFDSFLRRRTPKTDIYTNVPPPPGACLPTYPHQCSRHLESWFHSKHKNEDPFIGQLITLSTTCELVTGRTPFEADFDDRALIPQFQKVIGGLPELWIRDALSSGVLKEPPDSLSSPIPPWLYHHVSGHS
jgi:hypothetical protein